MKVIRLKKNPIITGDMRGLEGEKGKNINGPSLMSAPPWLKSPLGKYYLYFAHHQGRYIRLAYADSLEGPWSLLEEGTLQLDETRCTGHIASPDVHIDEDKRELWMYFHGNYAGGQRTFLARSADGIHFNADAEDLGPFYFRVFRRGKYFYAIAKANGSGLLLRSGDGRRRFKEGPRILPGMRHAAVRLDGDMLWVFFSRIGDCPESILCSQINLVGDWRDWRPSEPQLVLEPGADHEGVALPLAPSVAGASMEAVRQLRDPAVFAEGKKTYLLYSVAGEQGIAIAELTE